MNNKKTHFNLNIYYYSNTVLYLLCCEIYKIEKSEFLRKVFVRVYNSVNCTVLFRNLVKNIFLQNFDF